MVEANFDYGKLIPPDLASLPAALQSQIIACLSNAPDHKWTTGGIDPRNVQMISLRSLMLAASPGGGSHFVSLLSLLRSSEDDSVTNSLYSLLHRYLKETELFDGSFF
jgi:hypothetical protein